MNIEANADANVLRAAIESLGGLVVWSEGAPTKSVTCLEVEVDNEAAYNALPSGYFDHWDDEIVDRADPFDVRDFAVACGRGDRMLAGALAARIFPSPTNQAVFEHGLFGRTAS